MDNSDTAHITPVLIIDDEEDICYMLSSILKVKAYTPAAVHTISEASSWILKQHPALIFLDNNLPDGRGVDFIQDLKKQLPLTKIIMITAYDTPTDRRLALENGADEFIGKPFSRQAIFNVVDKLLN